MFISTATIARPMNVSICKSPLDQTAVDAVVVGLFADKNLASSAAEADRATDGLLTKLIELTGKKFELYAPVDETANQVYHIEIG